MKKGILKFDGGAAIVAAASAVGKYEHEGPLGDCFDLHDSTDKFGMNTWERAESEMQRLAFNTALAKASAKERDVEALFAGDLLNQCVGSSYGLLDFDIPYFGLYGACSTAAESIMLASAFVSAGYFSTAARTPLAIRYPKPVSGVVAPAPASSAKGSYAPTAPSITPATT